jgi:Protein of unknown function (DUF2782)
MHPYRSTLRHALGVALFAAAVAAFAQGASPPVPANLEPLPEIPPPPEFAQDPDLEPQITIRKKEGGDTIEEARVNGQLKWIKVTPSHGRPYFLIPDRGGTRYVRRDSLDYGLKVPMWLIFEF